MVRVPAIELAPGVVRIPTIGAAATNSFALVDADGSVTLVDCGVKRTPARVVAMPGHTSGHVSLLHEPSATLITDGARDAVRGFLAEVGGG